MKQAIRGYRIDDCGDWVAELVCGHFQHVRHNPPWIMRDWVLSGEGRRSKLGHALECVKCDRGDPLDYDPAAA